MLRDSVFVRNMNHMALRTPKRLFKEILLRPVITHTMAINSRWFDPWQTDRHRSLIEPGAVGSGSRRSAETSLDLKNFQQQYVKLSFS